MPQTAIILVNWNGSKDTLECISSFIHPVKDAHFFIVDNASSDDSVPDLKRFLENNHITYSFCQAAQLEASFDQSKQVTLIRNATNQGFAGANNIVLQFLTSIKHYQYAWLLNNDTTVVQDSFVELVNAIQANSEVAFCGSVLLDYTKSKLIQCCGVRYYKYLGVSKLFLKNEEWDMVKQDIVPLSDGIYYQNGASLLVDVSKLKQAGLMDESFFLYSEEADWQIRAQKKGFKNITALKSVIYHKGSISTVGRKHVFFYNYNRSAILMSRKNFGIFPSITATFSLLFITMIRARLDGKSVFHGIKGICSGWMQRITS